MSNAQHVKGIVNGHWEPTPPRSPLTAVRMEVAKFLQKISHVVEPEHAANAQGEQHDPIAAE